MTTIRHGSTSSFSLCIVAGSVSILLATIALNRKRRKYKLSQSLQLPTAYETLIGNGTPMVQLHHVSLLIGRRIFVKLESANPGGTGKDRAALSILQQAESLGLLPPPKSINKNTPMIFPNSNTNSTTSKLFQKIQLAMAHSRTGGLLVEGTSGSTGIALATLCAARGHACLVILPDDQAQEKQDILSALGAIVHVVPTAAISNPDHYVNLARKTSELAVSIGVAAVFGNQFETRANFDIHYQLTGPELYRQCPSIDAFCMSSGTGGTIAGVGKYLKEQSGKIQVVLVDPPGSALYNKVEFGVAYASEQAERTLRRHRYDTLAEGIGLDRVTNNFQWGLTSIDKAQRVTDQEAVDMAHWLLYQEGLWVGSSSAMNVVAAIRTALSMPAESTVVTIICDGGQRHVTRFWNKAFVKEWGLEWPKGDDTNDPSPRIPECLQGIYNGSQTYADKMFRGQHTR